MNTQYDIDAEDQFSFDSLFTSFLHSGDGDGHGGDGGDGHGTNGEEIHGGDGGGVHDGGGDHHE
ncbi:unnamed protein product [Cylicostephanus goldi]|uniref:Uncharacterized protein n=1 Tax=Cylicostephanus goldi TaxID=71465 RepID=A0A3P7QYM3_CYLGO|nr:unnamed protein product [Cylicostephanus goldi]